MRHIVNCENVLIYFRFVLLQDDEDSISELMVDKDKKSRFKLEKVGQVIIIKSILILALDLRFNVTKLLFSHFDEIVKIYQKFFNCSLFDLNIFRPLIQLCNHYNYHSRGHCSYTCISKTLLVLKGTCINLCVSTGIVSPLQISL